MIRRELWIPLAAAVLTAAFLLVSWLVRLSRGNPWLLRRKLRLGAVLLGLTWAAAGCEGDGITGGGTCYAPLPPSDEVEFDARFYDGRGWVLDLAQGSEMTGTLDYRTSAAYAFQLVATGGSEIQRGDLAASDGAFDESSEAFRLVLDPAGLPAEALLRIYKRPADAIDAASKIFEQPLTIKAAP